MGVVCVEVSEPQSSTLFFHIETAKRREVVWGVRHGENVAKLSSLLKLNKIYVVESQIIITMPTANGTITAVRQTQFELSR